MVTLTQTQQSTLDYLTGYQIDNGRLPTVREIQHNFGLASTSVAANRLNALEQRGFIIRLPEDFGKARGYKLAQPALPDNVHQCIANALGNHWDMSNPEDKAAAVEAVFQTLVTIPQATRKKRKKHPKNKPNEADKYEYSIVPARWTFLVGEMEQIDWEIFEAEPQLVGQESPLVLMRRLKHDE